MLGFTYFSASMSVGAKIGNGLGFHDFLLAVFFIKNTLMFAFGAVGGALKSCETDPAR